MAIAVRAVGATVAGAWDGTQSNVNLSVPVPAGVQDGDYLVMVYRSQASNSGSKDPTANGWTLHTISVDDAVAGGRTRSDTRVTSMLGAPAPSGTKPSSYSFNLVFNQSARYTAFMIAFSGVDTAAPFIDRTFQHAVTSTSPVEAWTAVPNRYVIEMWASEFSANNDHALGSYTGGLAFVGGGVSPSSGLVSASRSAFRIHAGYVGSTGQPAHNNHASGTQASPQVRRIALKDAAVTPPPAVGLDATLYKTGQANKAVKLTVWTGTQELAPSVIGVLPKGYYSVDHMLLQDEFMMAHRGGSADWPEMTRRAYTNAANWGAGLLEFSTVPTSDGVWVGSHDVTTTREFPDYPSVDIRNVTWNQIKDYRTHDGNHPFYVLQDFLREFGKTHLCMIDNKAALRRTEYYDILDSYGGPNRFMNKSWSGSAGNRDVARLGNLRGYKSWGFIYDSEIANLPTWQEHWYCMGLEYSASQSSWDALVNLGRPIIAHIMPTPATVQTAKTKILQAMQNTGKTVRYGYQISGVKACIPRRIPASVTLL